MIKKLHRMVEDGEITELDFNMLLLERIKKVNGNKYNCRVIKIPSREIGFSTYGIRNL